LGRAVLWQPGTDHAGIATQMVVERQLNAQGIKRTDLSRGAFIERVWRWKEKSGGTINAQMRRLGDSVDWSRDRFTMDAGLSRALTGKQVRLPLAGRLIPVIADAYVDPAFGSGCLKITPAHDFNDYEIGQRHHLPLINIFTPRATLADTVPERFRGLERFEA